MDAIYQRWMAEGAVALTCVLHTRGHSCRAQAHSGCARCARCADYGVPRGRGLRLDLLLGRWTFRALERERTESQARYCQTAGAAKSQSASLLRSTLGTLTLALPLTRRVLHPAAPCAQSSLCCRLSPLRRAKSHHRPGAGPDPEPATTAPRTAPHLCSPQCTAPVHSAT